jgi:hypothetical protein
VGRPPRCRWAAARWCESAACCSCCGCARRIARPCRGPQLTTSPSSSLQLQELRGEVAGWVGDPRLSCSLESERLSLGLLAAATLERHVLPALAQLARLPAKRPLLLGVGQLLLPGQRHTRRSTPACRSRDDTNGKIAVVRPAASRRRCLRWRLGSTVPPARSMTRSRASWTGWASRHGQRDHRGRGGLYVTGLLLLLDARPTQPRGTRVLPGRCHDARNRLLRTTSRSPRP